MFIFLCIPLPISELVEAIKRRKRIRRERRLQRELAKKELKEYGTND